MHGAALNITVQTYNESLVARQCSLNEPRPQVENIMGHASHGGMGMNPALALDAIADRLARAPGPWCPFGANGARRRFFQTGTAGSTVNSSASA